MIVHIGTRIQCVLGRLDENGNIVERKPVELGIDVLDEKAFVAACEKLREMKAQLEQVESGGGK